MLKAITAQIAGALPSDIVKNPKLSTFLVLPARSYPTMDPQCSTQIHSSINAITIHPKQQSDSCDGRTEENKEEEKDSPENIHFNSSTPPDPSVLFINEKVLKFNSFFESLGLVPPLTTRVSQRPLVVLLWVNTNALNRSIGFDNPVKDELEPHPAYDFFAPGPLPGYVGNLNNNRWLEANDYLLGELEAMADEPMVVLAIEEVAEPMVEEEEQMVAPVIDMEEDLVVLFGEDDDSEGLNKEED
ncbi:hypothetical protein Tco_0800543 [Tanacetum coccineum]|uniref:Uncharacterized protein n=1 Tax=Tanacetum coccineum TaxID=301880 RepID=A0ABQ4ZUD5_9ASTR